MEKTNIDNIQGTDLELLETKEIGIAGMTCDNCVRTIERALRGKEGVREVKVDRAKGLATVTYDTRKTNIPALHDILLKAGYTPTATAD